MKTIAGNTFHHLDYDDGQVFLAISKVNSNELSKPSFLSLTEQEYAQWCQRSSIKAKNNYLAARHLAKQLLVEYVDGTQQDWQIVNDLSGAPKVYRAGLCSATRLSIAHSGEWVVCLLSPDGDDVGVDIECVRQRTYLLDMVMMLAHPSEKAWLLNNASSLCSMYRYWTAKEAIAKWSGCAIGSEALKAMVFDFSDGVWRLKKFSHYVKHFTLANTGYVGAWIAGKRD